ncbi:hypothetical protein [Flagellimonas sp.]|uniref:hypothetical protein n=1 Tax=Flagellimonas sp. TaxID=2058762 RepID=UPI003BAD6B91
MPCTDTIATENIDFCADQENPAGISPVEIYCARVIDFDTIEKPTALGAALTLVEAGSITAAHTFTAPKGFFKINILPDTGSVETTNEGEKGSKTNTNVFSGTLPGNSARNIGFIRKYQNVGMIFIVKQINGEMRQIGSQDSPAYLTEASGTTGLKAGDINGMPVKFADVQSYPAPVYTGTITEFGGV